MGYLLTGLLMIGFVLLFLFAFVRATPSALASTLRMLGPLLAVLTGLGFTAAGRFGYGVPLILLGLLWWYHSRRQSIKRRRNRTSVFRTAWLEITINQDSGKLDGLVLTGGNEGSVLSQMTMGGLLDFYRDLSDDPESAELMEAYLDRHLTGWRENTNARTDSGHGSPSRPGPMTEQEAYQILGLESGASAEEIGSCYQRLKRIVGADSTGSELLASRVDEAKDTLLN